MELVNLADDPSEKRNIAERHTDRLAELSIAFDHWIATMANPITGGPKRTDTVQPAVSVPEQEKLTERERKREQIRAERKKQRDAQKRAKNQS